MSCGAKDTSERYAVQQWTRAQSRVHAPLAGVQDVLERHTLVHTPKHGACFIVS